MQEIWKYLEPVENPAVAENVEYWSSTRVFLGAERNK
jgi:hypothetical protein